jgi:hypothetical protein
VLVYGSIQHRGVAVHNSCMVKTLLLLLLL